MMPVKILRYCLHVGYYLVYYFTISVQTALRNKPAIVGVLRSKPSTEFQYVFPPLTLRLQETLEPVNGYH